MKGDDEDKTRDNHMLSDVRGGTKEDLGEKIAHPPDAGLGAKEKTHVS